MHVLFSHCKCFIASSAKLDSISSGNLEWVRKLKSAMTRLTNRVQKVRDELEQLLEDDDDMAHLYLSKKLAGACSPVSVSGAPNWYLSSQTIGLKISRTSRASAVTVQEDNDVEELEMLLEAYFMQIDSTLNKLTTLREYIDDTEDYISIQVISLTIIEISCFYLISHQTLFSAVVQWQNFGFVVERFICRHHINGFSLYMAARALPKFWDCLFVDILWLLQSLE
ncbi:hypothetical protein CRYUN_Cryun01aG0164900 [Craigia yunnanensis]